MAAKGFICEVDLYLNLLSTLGNHECPLQYVYLTVELFGQVHKTKPQHAYYPLVFNETIRAEKTFWSAENEDDVLDMLDDAQIIIELRRIDPCFYNGLLLAYYDGNAKDVLFSRYPRMPCSTNGRELYFERTIDFKGTAPRLRYSAFSNLRRLGAKIDDSYSGKFNSINNRIDDGYNSPTQSLKDTNINKSDSRQSRSPKRCYSPIANETSSAPYYTRQTVASAIRSRSPSPFCNRSGANNELKEYYQTGDSGFGSDKSKEPFVVKKVQENLIHRNPKLHNHLPRDGSRKSRPKRQTSVNKKQEINTLRSQSNSERRFRSASPTKQKVEEKDNKLEIYQPSKFNSNVISSYDIPHYCYRCTGRCHSPFLGYYSNRLSTLSCCSGSHYGCHSRGCYW